MLAIVDPTEMGSPAYTILLLTGIAGGAIFWSRLAKRDDRLMNLFVAALVGAFVGAKISYVISEGLADFAKPNPWLRLAAGKSITGGLFFGYIAVELVKKYLGINRVTGDWFASVVPSALALGRLGCYLNGCCPGQLCSIHWFQHLDRHGEARYPAALIELLFNAALALGFVSLRRRKHLIGQHFHLYLIAYGSFRLITEFWRATPRLVGPLSGYQLFAIALVVLGALRFAQRARLPKEPPAASQANLPEFRETTCKTVSACAP
jgi:phosphatidylglycerol:prolipoprotein diacylglycerol transferase